MKRDAVEIVAATLAIVLCAACEEMLPKFLGAGAPFLLMAAIFWAARRSSMSAIIFAIAAGAAEDAISALPFAASITFFALLAAFVLKTSFVWSVFALAYPAYQLWLGMWCGQPADGIFSRFLVSLPVGMLTAGAVFATLSWMERKGAMNAEA